MLKVFIALLLIVSTASLVVTAPSVFASESAAAPSEYAAAPMTRVEFDTLMQDISNWGRWGDADELGTLNLITKKNRKSAARLVKKGISVSLALPLNKVQDALNANPFIHEVGVSEFGGHQVAGDRYEVDYHGFAHSHMDGLPHFAHKGSFYNGVPFDAAKPDGSEKLGIHNAGVKGVFSRGVLVDMPKHFGVDYLTPGHAITEKDLLDWEKANRVKIGSGDVLLIRTGRWTKVAADGQWNFLDHAAGAQASIVRFLKNRDVAMIGSDGVSDVMPSGVEGLLNPLHELVLVGLGMPILDNLDLDQLALVANENKRVTFLYVGAPLRVQGGTGSPLNPLAIF
ncbi:MAG: kynurenine formamidase [Candidatus Azotimanducaceae bacterium]|jgi:kynurenine formamidase